MEERENQGTAAADENVNNVLQTESQISDTPPDSEQLRESSDINAPTVDYAEIAREDLALLKSEFPELSDLRDICELNNPMRYAALRDLGLSPAEAYLATAKRIPKRDNRAHLSATGNASYSPQGSMSEAELSTARELFSDMSDAEIRKLYKKVNR